MILCNATDSMHCLCGRPKLLQDTLPCARLYTDAMLPKMFFLGKKEAYSLHAPSSADCFAHAATPGQSCIQHKHCLLV